MANEFIIKNGFQSKGNSTVEGLLTTTTISATTYQNVPTFSGGSISGGLTATTISATTISGGTYFGDSSNLEGMSATNILLTQFFS